MARIIIDMFPARSHYNSTLKLAGLLKERGHQVDYFVTTEFDAELKQKNFSTCVTESFVVPRLRIRKKQYGGFFFFRNLLDAFENNVWKVTMNNVDSLRNILGKLRSDIVL